MLYLLLDLNNIFNGISTLRGYAYLDKHIMFKLYRKLFFYKIT